MKIITTKFIISLLFIVALGLFSIPQFTLSVGDKELEYPELTAKIIGVGSTSVGTLRRGSGIFSEQRFQSKVNFANNNLSTEEKRNKLQHITTIVSNRAKLSGLYDIDISQLNNDELSLISFDIPSHYTKPSNIVGLLTKQGSIKFEAYGEQTSTPIDLKDSDVVGSIQTEYDTRYGNYLSFNFDGSKKDILNSAFGVGGQGGVITMLVDDVPSFYLIPTTQNNNSEAIVTKVKALPSLEIFPDDKEQPLSLKIIASFFYNDPLDDSLDLESLEPEILLPDYAPSGGSMIAIMFILSAVFCAFYILYKNKLKAGIFFGLLLSSYILLVISILKIFGAIVSMGSVTGFLVTYCIMVVLIDQLLKVQFDEFKSQLKKYSYYSIFVLILSIFMYRFSAVSGNIADFIGTILVFGLSSLLLCNTMFKFIIDFYHLNPKFTLKRK